MARRSPPKSLDTLIDEAGIPLGKLADAAGIDAKTLLAIRKGLWKSPRVATVAKLAQALGVDPATVRSAIEAQRGGK